MTAASYGDTDVARVLIDAGATLDATASATSGGVPGGTALRHAAVFGMTEVLDLLVAAGARIGHLTEAAACHGHVALATHAEGRGPAGRDRSGVLGNGTLTTEAVPAAILAFLRSPDDPAAVVRFAPRMGGDTDAIAGARCGAGALPSTWRTRTDIAPAIRTAADRLVRAADSAMHMYPGHARE